MHRPRRGRRSRSRPGWGRCAQQGPAAGSAHPGEAGAGVPPRAAHTWEWGAGAALHTAQRGVEVELGEAGGGAGGPGGGEGGRSRDRTEAVWLTPWGNGGPPGDSAQPPRVSPPRESASAHDWPRFKAGRLRIGRGLQVARPGLVEGRIAPAPGPERGARLAGAGTVCARAGLGRRGLGLRRRRQREAGEVPGWGRSGGRGPGAGFGVRRAGAAGTRRAAGPPVLPTADSPASAPAVLAAPAPQPAARLRPPPFARGVCGLFLRRGPVPGFPSGALCQCCYRGGAPAGRPL